MANKNAIIQSDLSKPQKVIGLIACLGQEIKSEMARILKPFGISMIQLDILHALSKSPEKVLTVNQIKKLMIDDSPNVSRALNKLMDADLIEKKRDLDDQRVVYIHITEKGEQMHVDADNALMSVKFDMDMQDAEQLYKLLVKL